MLSGFFFAVAVLRYGVTEWRETFINTGHSDIRIGAWWDWAIRLVVVEAVVLMAWMLWGARGDGWAAALTPLSSYNIGSVLIQWAIILAILIGANRFLVGKSLGGKAG
jgi:NSS family neurotransmitter:Na+ symporter